MNIDLIIPAINEEKAIANVLGDVPKHIVRYMIVCDNGSSDQTPEVARKAGAIVVTQPVRGYGNACLKGMEYLANLTEKSDIVVFLDGDYSDFPADMLHILQPILEGKADMVIGSRVLGNAEKGALLPQQRFGNWLATWLIGIFYGVQFTDLGPFRAIRYDKLLQLNMKDQNFGWTVEMQVKAAKLRFACVEVPVNYRKRIGISKVSGTIKGSFRAGQKILWVIFRELSIYK
jgi:glycosyltransferase involved in cell wall biosynthesis